MRIPILELALVGTIVTIGSLVTTGKALEYVALRLYPPRALAGHMDHADAMSILRRTPTFAPPRDPHADVIQAFQMAILDDTPLGSQEP